MRVSTIKKIIITFMLLVLVRIIAHIPVPWTDAEALKGISELSFFTFSNLFSGGALGKFTFGAVGISSYISASIIIQILSFFVLPIRRAQKSPAGQLIIRKLTVVLGVVMAFSSSLLITYFLDKQYSFLLDNTIYVYLTAAVCQTIGAVITIAAGLYIEKEGIGNGITVLIFVNIVASFPTVIEQLINSKELQNITTQGVVIFITVSVVAYLISVFMQRAELRIPLINVYAPSSRLEQKRHSYFPMKVCYAGVMPAIFGQYIISVWEFVIGYTGTAKIRYYSDKILGNFWTYGAIYAVLTVTFIIVVSKIYYEFPDINTSLEQRGNLIAGVNPGITAIKFLKAQHRRLMIIYTLYLILIIVVPAAIYQGMDFSLMSSITVVVAADTSFEFRTYIQNERNLYKISDKKSLEWGKAERT